MPQSDTYWLFALYRKFNCQFYKNHLNSNNLNKSLTVKELYERPDRREFWVYLPTYLKSLGLHIGLFSFSSKNPLLYYIFCCRPVHSQDLKKQIFTKTTKSKIKWSYSTYLTKHLNSTTCRNKRRAPKGGADVRSRHDKFCDRSSHTILDQRSISPVSLHGILGRFVYLRRSLN